MLNYTFDWPQNRHIQKEIFTLQIDILETIVSDDCNIVTEDINCGHI